MSLKKTPHRELNGYLENCISLLAKSKVLPLLILLSARLTCAQTIWTDASGDWFDPANWSAGVPNSATDAQINNDGIARIGVPGASASRLDLGYDAADSGNVVVSGSGTLKSLGFLLVGHAGKGTVTLENGAFLSDGSSNVGNDPGSNGSVLVEGAGAAWATDSFLNIGYYGTGILTIRNGGTVSTWLGYVGTNPGSYGAVLVDGVGSTFTGSLRLGDSGRADVTVQNGGVVTGTGVVNIGGYLGRGIVLVDGPGSTLTSDGRVNVGDDGVGRLTIRNGGTVSGEEGYIGRTTGGDGVAVVEGVGSTWISPYLEVGGYGPGSLTIRDGGAVVSHVGSAKGNVLIDGVGSNWTATDRLGVDDLTIQNGATVSSHDGFVGTAVIDGAGSTWSTEFQFTVADSPDANLTIRNGGKVANRGQGTIGYYNGYGGVVSVDGVGSSWINNLRETSLDVGFFSPGTLDIVHGGVVTSFKVYVGVGSSSSGHITVNGADSALNIDSLLVVGGGDTGSGAEPGGLGQLQIINGGQVSSANTTIFAAVDIGVQSPSGNIIVVNGAGSTLNIDNVLLVGGGDTGSGGEPGGLGQLQIINGGQVSSANTTIFSRGTINNNGLFTGDEIAIEGGLLSGGGDIEGNITNGGRFTVGDPIAPVALDGDYTQLTNGELTLELAGTDQVASDHLDITGNVTLDGLLTVRFVNDFLPLNGQVFKLLHIGGAMSGAFAQIAFPDLRNGFQFQAELVNGDYQVTALNDGIRGTGFLNISTRMQVGAGDNTLIGGFIVTTSTGPSTGSGRSPGPDGTAKTVILRAIGPSLMANGMPWPGRLGDPILELRDSAGGLLTFNDNWMESAQVQQIIESGIAPTDKLESVIMATIAPGAYTAVMRGNHGTVGIGVVEVYDVTPAFSAKLANISTRGLVETDDKVMIGGFIADNQAMRVLVRGLGPSLAQSGVPNPLPDPTLELHDGQGAMIASNDDWKETNQAAIEGTGIAPPNEKESAILATLFPGNYTAIVRGKNFGTGIGLVEVYDLQ